MEQGPLPAFEDGLRGRRVLVTGHTGFTGSWLSLWLDAIGCEVAGLALAPETTPNLYDAAQVGHRLRSHIGDIRDLAFVARVADETRPEIVFHLAAQPLVRRSYGDPLETFTTNAIGTANILEVARLSAGIRAVVCITTDKVYADHHDGRRHVETDEIGGTDPYSASKASADLITSCYRNNLAARGNGVAIATARGGNIIGGGDWSDDRIVPDFVRAVTSGAPLVLRRPNAVRPWQHVLALVHGYLLLGERLLAGAAAEAWNFGPTDDSAVTVGAVVERLAAIWRAPAIEYRDAGFHETQLLMLDSTKARRDLGWNPPLGLDDTLRLTAEWYRDHEAAPASAAALTRAQIDGYRRALARVRRP